LTVDESNIHSDGRLRSLLVCPMCQGSLAWSETEAICLGCASTYPIHEGIASLAPPGFETSHDEINHDHARRSMAKPVPDTREHDHAEMQARWFDLSDREEFEIERPAGAPALYGWLLREKLRRGLGPVAADLEGRTAVAVCGGSGMDAEFLADHGARVITVDISLGAARRAAERGRRRGLTFLSVVADAEHLPFADSSIDLVYVHDGLHHLEDPMAALDEMSRVAAQWVSVTEPARARMTNMAVRLGLALDREAAGNKVVRFMPAELVSRLSSANFRALQVGRYAMYYSHEPGTVFKLLSAPVVLPFATGVWRVGNAVFGRLGNKVGVVARRVSPTEM
jgi:SAM-dependent methyltransferase/uncharacterized protein YbaR (Trm112 family)